ncbi:nuclear transport factor 2 family protein [Amycolatopsis nigrescens]|uniref:nuclear transport factor 2 family protein n=1 Tax=Amycolatopsis nigrescens TaxID=381445 RepID=UPI00036611E7|nr:nuclear transport factor 2 family protein [Amycolatopsis nigrescens]
MSDIKQTVEQYLGVWNETDPARRRELVEWLYTEDVTYTDPLGAVSGWDGLDGFIAGARQQLSGLVFSLAGEVDAHHDIARFTWHLGTPGAAEPLAIGFDVVTVENGRISQVLGFLDKLPG